MGDLLINRTNSERDEHPIRHLTDDVFELIARLGLFALLLFWAAVLIRPFVFLALWSLILTVTLYPAFDWTARVLGGRRKLAAAIVTALALAVFTGPVIWLGSSLMTALTTLSERLGAGTITIPPPSEEVKTWPLIGRATNSG